MNPNSPDVTIIGGGIIGLACAWRLAQGGAKVRVLERLQTGREASWAAAGLLAPACEAAFHPVGNSEQVAAMEKLCFSSRDLYVSFAAELEGATGHDLELSLKGHTPPDEWREPGILVFTDDAIQREKLRPYGTTALHHGDVWLPNEGQIENRKLVEALRAAAKSAGVIIQEKVMVRRILEKKGAVCGWSDELGEHACGAILMCAGAWLAKIGLPNEMLPPVGPITGQMLVLRAERRVKHIYYGQHCYLVPRRDGRLLIGATVEYTGFAKRVTAGGVSHLLNAALKLAPELKDAPFETSWAGLRPTTTDGLPILGKTPLENLWIATGHGRNGILLTPKTARLLADAILNGEATPEAFSLARFSSNADSSQRLPDPDGGAKRA